MSQTSLEPQKLYLVHCGFYDPTLSGGLYESHTDFFVVAESFEDARAKAKKHPDYLARKMHVDGLLEVKMVDGYQIGLTKVDNDSQTITISHRHRELASTSNQNS